MPYITFPIYEKVRKAKYATRTLIVADAQSGFRIILESRVR